MCTYIARDTPTVVTSPFSILCLLKEPPYYLYVHVVKYWPPI